MPIDHAQIEANLREHRKFYLFEGALLTLVGVLAIVIPAATAVAINIIIAIALLIGGVGRLVTSGRRTSDRIWKLLGGLLFLVGGLLMLLFPMQGVAALVLVLGVMLLLEGVLGIAAALSWQSHRFSGWFLASGILSLILGLIVLAMFPEAGVFYLAIIVGLSFILSGVSVFMVAWDAR